MNTPKVLFIKESVITTLLTANPHFNDGPLHYKAEVKYLSEESVNEMLAEKDKEIARLKSDVNKLNLLLYQNELNFNKICNCIHKGKSTSALCTGMCNR